MPEVSIESSPSAILTDTEDPRSATDELSLSIYTLFLHNIQAVWTCTVAHVIARSTKYKVWTCTTAHVIACSTKCQVYSMGLRRNQNDHAQFKVQSMHPHHNTHDHAQYKV